MHVAEPRRCGMLHVYRLCTRNNILVATISWPLFACGLVRRQTSGESTSIARYTST